MEAEQILNRPKWNDEMTKELSVIIGKKVNEWCKNETDLEDCIETCEIIFKWSRHDNGYELAKRFEDEGFSPDVELVEILDDYVSHSVNKIKENHIRSWVKDNNLKLKYEVGQFVSAKTFFRGEINGEIMKVYPDTLQYGIWYESMGYSKGNGHTIIDEENIINLISK